MCSFLLSIRIAEETCSSFLVGVLDAHDSFLNYAPQKIPKKRILHMEMNRQMSCKEIFSSWVTMKWPKCDVLLTNHSDMLNSHTLMAIVFYNLCPK